MKYKNTIIFIVYLIPILLMGQFNERYKGFGLDIGSSGSGVFITFSSLHSSEKISLNSELRFYDIKAPDETLVYDYYSGQTRNAGGISLVMFPAFVGVNYYPFAGKIENNFSPFITTRGGLVFTIDGKESGSFKNRWTSAKTQFSPGGFIGAGVDFKMVGQTFVSTMFGLEIIKLNEAADSVEDYSGFLIHLSFNRRLK
tara:strand:- start:505 stop:1101 length:597 start_codon:yes stop_codon:yes gene_type:complete